MKHTTTSFIYIIFIWHSNNSVKFIIIIMVCNKNNPSKKDKIFGHFSLFGQYVVTVCVLDSYSSVQQHNLIVQHKQKLVLVLTLVLKKLGMNIAPLEFFIIYDRTNNYCKMVLCLIIQNEQALPIIIIQTSFTIDSFH